MFFLEIKDFLTLITMIYICHVKEFVNMKLSDWSYLIITYLIVLNWIINLQFSKKKENNNMITGIFQNIFQKLKCLDKLKIPTNTIDIIKSFAFHKIYSFPYYKIISAIKEPVLDLPDEIRRLIFYYLKHSAGCIK